jgi:succinylglutamate desuccinylase
MSDTAMLNELEALPSGLLDLDATGLHAALGGPTLIHLEGRREPALFVSVLLHGNETTGWEAIRELLQRYTPGGGEAALPRSLALFIGNTAAAAAGLRRLDGQPDYNRVWPGGDGSDSPERRLMAQVVARMAERGVFASVDVHNNTGPNPHYACVNVVEPRTLHLAALFGRTVVHFQRPRGVAAMAMATLCPSVTLECGRAGQVHGTEHARDYLDACLHLAEHPTHPVAAHDVDLFRTVAIVKIPAEVRFGFAGNALDLCLAGDLDRLNFRELPAGTPFGEVCGDATRGIPLDVRDDEDADVAARYFERAGRELRTRLPLMPAMLTQDVRVIRQDCLCYLMER